jgi:hypothetical protein
MLARISGFGVDQANRSEKIKNILKILISGGKAGETLVNSFN